MSGISTASKTEWTAPMHKLFTRMLGVQFTHDNYRRCANHLQDRSECERVVKLV